MSIAQAQSPVSPSVGAIGDIPLTSFTISELEALLEAAATALRTGQNLYNGLLDCGTDRQFDAETLGELEFEHQSRDELIGLVGAIASRLHELETNVDVMLGDEDDEMRLNDILAAQWTNEIESRGGCR